jgi:hypothetical protein
MKKIKLFHFQLILKKKKRRFLRGRKFFPVFLMMQIHFIQSQEDLSQRKMLRMPQVYLVKKIRRKRMRIRARAR